MFLPNSRFTGFPHIHRLSDLNLSLEFELVCAAAWCPRPQQNMTVSICCRGSCCALFSIFQLVWSLLELCSLTPVESWDGVCSVLKLLWTLKWLLLSRGELYECDVSVDNQCGVKHNTSWVSASLWINVHSVKKINGINTISLPQRCGISLLQQPSAVFFKINICHICTQLSGRNLKRVVFGKAGDCGSSEMIRTNDSLIWTKTECFWESEIDAEWVFFHNQIV